METELLLVCGLAGAAVQRVADRLLTAPGTAVAHHELAEVRSGVVRRRLRVSRAVPGGVLVREETAVLELAHGCVSCTLREDVLPLVRTLAAEPGVRRIVLHLDPVLEPEPVSWAVLHVLLDGSPVGRDVELAGVITVLDRETFLDDAVCDDDLAGRGLAKLSGADARSAGAPLGDERTIAQLVVGQAEFADLIVYDDRRPDEWLRARTDAVLARLTPLAPRITPDRLDPAAPLATIPATARRGVPDHPHAALLRGQPPLHEDSGAGLLVFTARRPFHPGRLHDAMDVLLDGVIRSRGRIWLATRPEAVLLIESAGGGLQVGYVDDWLAARDPADTDAWADTTPERRTAAALRWHPRWGDRVQELTVLTCGADADEITEALRGALLTDVELATGDAMRSDADPLGAAAWRHYPDPFGQHHTDPCGDVIPTLPPLAGGGRIRPEGDA